MKQTNLNLAIVTATRAEYGLLARIIEKVEQDPYYNLNLYVTGTHLLPDYGLTIKEIIQDGVKIKRLIDIYPLNYSQAFVDINLDISESRLKAVKDLLAREELGRAFFDQEYLEVLEEAHRVHKNIIDCGTSTLETSQIVDNASHQINLISAIALAKFSRVLLEDDIDAVLVLGDRYELLPIANACLNLNLPLIHIGGGEISFGAIDEYVRHALTKMAYLHFPSEDEFAKRILQMGEETDRVFCLGDTGVENVNKLAQIKLEDIEKELNINHKPYYLITFHPETMSSLDENKEQLLALLEVLKDKNDFNLIFTGVNADRGHDLIQDLIYNFAESKENVYVFSSLGIMRYINLMRAAIAVVGNSSSALIEAPACGVPTVNVGNRQLGRKSGDTIINASTYDEIKEGFAKIERGELATICKMVKEKIEDTDVAERIVECIKNNIPVKGKIIKKFVDRPFKS